jgi:hypothetical protein
MARSQAWIIVRSCSYKLAWFSATVWSNSLMPFSIIAIFSQMSDTASPRFAASVKIVSGFGRGFAIEILPEGCAFHARRA